MRYDFAPMEGITTALYRKFHHSYFPGVDRYYTPFLSPTRDHVFTPRERREILPELPLGGRGTGGHGLPDRQSEPGLPLRHGGR